MQGPHKTHQYTAWGDIQNYWFLNRVVHIITTMLWMVRLHSVTHLSIFGTYYFLYPVSQRCTNPLCQVTAATKSYTEAPNICVFSKFNLLHVTLLGSSNFKLASRFFLKLCAHLVLSHLLVRLTDPLFPSFDCITVHVSSMLHVIRVQW